MKRPTADRKSLFISSVQKELQQERRAVKEFVQGDALLRRYFDVFLFEDLPAKDRKADDAYLEEVDQCDVYVGLFGNEYGLDMIERCRDAGIPEPDFEQRAGQFVVTLWRDWLTADIIASLDLNDRQQKAIAKMRITGRISNSKYQKLTGAIKKTATRDLEDLVAKGVLAKIGRTGRGTYYVLAKIGDKKGTKGT